MVDKLDVEVVEDVLDEDVVVELAEVEVLEVVEVEEEAGLDEELDE